MTTVAINKDEEGNIVIASDSRMIGNYIDQAGATKVFEVELMNGSKAYVTGSGSYSGMLQFLEWVTNGMEKNEFPVDASKDSDFIIVTKDGVFCYDGGYIPIKLGLPFSTGSGSHLALGAMAYKCPPQEAVKIAAKYDPGTDSKVKVYKLATKKSR